MDGGVQVIPRGDEVGVFSISEVFGTVVFGEF